MRVRRDFTLIKSSSERVNNAFEPTFQFGIYLSKVCGIPNKREFENNLLIKICRWKMGGCRIK
jgi:hypothetical protein